MHDPLLVRGAERGGDGHEEARRPRTAAGRPWRLRSPESGSPRSSSITITGVWPPPLEDVEHLDHVGVLDRGRRLGLAEEAPRLRGVDDAADHLERHVAPGADVLGGVDLPIPPLPMSRSIRKRPAIMSPAENEPCALSGTLGDYSNPPATIETCGDGARRASRQWCAVSACLWVNHAKDRLESRGDGCPSLVGAPPGLWGRLAANCVDLGRRRRDVRRRRVPELREELACGTKLSACQAEPGCAAYVGCEDACPIAQNGGVDATCGGACAPVTGSAAKDAWGAFESRRSSAACAALRPGQRRGRRGPALHAAGVPRDADVRAEQRRQYVPQMPVREVL